MITHVAIIIDGEVQSLPKPNRHHNIIKLFPMPKHKQGEQGFIDDRRGFVGRHEALCIVLGYKQELRFGEFCDPQHGLFSEDLW